MFKLKITDNLTSVCFLGFNVTDYYLILLINARWAVAVVVFKIKIKKIGKSRHGSEGKSYNLFQQLHDAVVNNRWSLLELGCFSFS